MAIYQYYLGIVPRVGIEKIHNSIPDEIGVRVEKGYFESDAAIYWQEVVMKSTKLVEKMDLIVNRSDLGDGIKSISWKAESEAVDNDASLFLEETTSIIKEFSFRADLREKDLKFLKDMVALGVDNGWLLFDLKGKLMQPDLAMIAQSIIHSNAYRFLTEPAEFLADVIRQKR